MLVSYMSLEWQTFKQFTTFCHITLFVIDNILNNVYHFMFEV